MRTWHGVSLVWILAAAAWTLSAGTARAQDIAAGAEFAQSAAPAAEPGDIGTDVLTRPPRGSLAAQLRLKLSLQMAGGDSLAAALDHNRQEWEMLTPDQRERFRSMAVAFLDKDPAEQEKLLQSYSAFLSLDKQKREAYRQRADWVRAVVATFTPAERQQLQQMSSVDRAKALLARRDQLVRDGRLTLTTRPATAPAE